MCSVVHLAWRLCRATSKGALVAINTTSYCRKEVVEVDAKLLPGAAVDVAAVQLAGDKALVPVTLPPYGFAVTNRTHARLHPSSSQKSHLILWWRGCHSGRSER
jgi:hypothetical protein